MNLVQTAVLTALIAGGAMAPAYAETKTSTFDVTMKIKKSCDITATENVAFGEQLASAGSVDATGSVSVKCTKNTPYQVSLNGGGAADTSARRMLSGTAAIPYQLYQEAGRSTVWGNTAADDKEATGTGFKGAATKHVVYARATLDGDQVAGDYTDTVTATVTF
ncbi:Csu type fimbrial protein [Novilysobacter luteus]|uniref:Spore coat protein U/FanG domain-containing protein n=1 Tax=Novilysobacter luteus TaxID=2822368 RepID=A0ABM8UGC8_9GAMM|nr:spore coat U domain-containing protein [Lysobacter luteus]CAG4974686.1 hypothetical protein LYB30171_01731 [Lysobacter luteus]